MPVSTISSVYSSGLQPKSRSSRQPGWCKQLVAACSWGSSTAAQLTGGSQSTRTIEYTMTDLSHLAFTLHSSYSPQWKMALQGHNQLPPLPSWVLMCPFHLHSMQQSPGNGCPAVCWTWSLNNPSKLEGTSTVVTFLGVKINSDAQELRLPQGKLAWIQATIKSWEGHWSTSKCDLQSLIGLLNHTTTVVRLGCTFLRQLIETMKVTKN